MSTVGDDAAHLQPLTRSPTQERDYRARKHGLSSTGYRFDHAPIAQSRFIGATPYGLLLTWASQPPRPNVRKTLSPRLRSALIVRFARGRFPKCSKAGDVNINCGDQLHIVAPFAYVDTRAIAFGLLFKSCGLPARLKGRGDCRQRLSRSRFLPERW